MTNKEKAKAINLAVQHTDMQAAASLVKEDYIQHTPAVPNGKNGLLMLLTRIRNKEIPGPVIKTIRAFEDGDYVVLHHEVYWPNRKVMFEIFRFEDGLAAEHWSGIADYLETSINGHSMIDGATEIKDRNNTEENKYVAEAFVQNILIQRRFDKIQSYTHSKLIQHNPALDNTTDGLISSLHELEKKGIKIEFERIHCVLGEGNFVLTLSEGKLDGKHTAFFDLFRIEEGKIIEHWDVLQEVPEKMAHDNGMFSVHVTR